MSLRNKQIKFALLLSIITVFYNIIEGALCIFFGLEHETLVLFGFGFGFVRSRFGLAWFRFGFGVDPV